MMIKLFVRLEDVRTITGHPTRKKQLALAKETLEFFVPMAKILKLKAVEQELLGLVEKYPELQSMEDTTR